MSATNHCLVEGTAVCLNGSGVLIQGPSGCGKSDLALRLIEGGARLVSDDIVELRRHDNRLLMAFPDAAPAYLKGKMEVRGLGIVSVPNEEDPVFLNLVVQSGRLAELERLPETTFARFCDVAVQIVELSLLEASATAKVRLALSRGPDDIIPAP